jgi:hypothetical protein
MPQLILEPQPPPDPEQKSHQDVLKGGFLTGVIDEATESDSEESSRKPMVQGVTVTVKLSVLYFPSRQTPP